MNGSFIKIPKASNLTIATMILVLLAYVIVFFLIAEVGIESQEHVGDGKRHARMAVNLSQGILVPPDEIWITNGPGYPLVVSIFRNFDDNWWWARFINPFLIFAALVMLYKTLSIYVPKKLALLAMVATACYYPLMLDVHKLHSEALTHFLIATWAYCTCRIFVSGKLKSALLCGLLFGYLCLTKVIFGYLLVISLFGIGIWAVISRSRKIVLLFSSFVIALLLCMPYLVHTYSLTGKAFHWADSGYTNLYWMTSPVETESGTWQPYPTALEREELSYHHPFVEYVHSLPYAERSEAFKEKAIEHIKENPSKYIYNWLSNIGRTLVNYPYDYTAQTNRSFFYFVPAFVLFYFLLRAFIVYFKQKPEIPVELLIIAIGGLIVYGGTTLLSASNRIVRPLIFMILPLMIFVLMSKYHNLKSKTDKNELVN